MEQFPIADAIALAVAPIFLLAGIGGLLNVMTARLGRVVDRARFIEGAFEAGVGDDVQRRYREELKALSARTISANRAIYATTSSALLVCIVVALLFLQQLTPLDVVLAVEVMFVATMGLLILGLGFFLHEISVATRSLKVRTDL
ncbi:MAG: DUF2721 domain-containing protein [Pseudomonadota bacterium]